MARKNIKTVDIENSIYAKIVKTASSENISIYKFVNEIIDQTLTKNEFVKLVMPKFSLVEVSEYNIIIKDEGAIQIRFAVIIIRDGKLWCELDEDYDCHHIHYVLTLPQLAFVKDRLKQI